MLEKAVYAWKLGIGAWLLSAPISTSSVRGIRELDWTEDVLEEAVCACVLIIGLELGWSRHLPAHCRMCSGIESWIGEICY